MNYKLEKFWKFFFVPLANEVLIMNYKLEKFWNGAMRKTKKLKKEWTINLKSFEISS